MRTISTLNKNAAKKVPSWPVDFVTLTIDPNNAASVLRLSTHFHTITLNGKDYVPSAQLLAIGNINEEIEVKDDSLDIQLSGVTNTISSIVLGNFVEGSLVEVQRGYYDDATGDLVDAPITRWKGRVSSYSIVDDYQNSRQDTVIVTLICKSLLTTMLGRQAGVFSSPESFEYYYPGDKSMEFVAATARFNPFFGKEN